MSARETSATCPLLRDMGAEVVAVAAAVVDQEGGRVRGDGLALRHADTTNCSKHVTTVRGQPLSVAKFPNGDWDTVQISRGTHEHLDKKKVHRNKTWYPSPVYG